MDEKNNQKLEKIKKVLEGIISQDKNEFVEEKEELLEENKPKRQLLKSNERLDI